MDLQFDKQISFMVFSPSVQSQAPVSMHICEEKAQLQQLAVSNWLCSITKSQHAHQWEAYMWFNIQVPACWDAHKYTANVPDSRESLFCENGWTDKHPIPFPWASG